MFQDVDVRVQVHFVQIYASYLNLNVNNVLKNVFILQDVILETFEVKVQMKNLTLTSTHFEIGPFSFKTSDYLKNIIFYQLYQIELPLVFHAKCIHVLLSKLFLLYLQKVV